MAQNPLAEALADWLPEIDFGVMRHGFAPHGRDYSFVVEVGGAERGATYELTFTHVVQLKYETRVHDQVWPTSWNDVLLDYAAWEAAGHPDGYVWGTNWSLAYPGVSAPDSDVEAEAWSKRLGQPMFAASIETDRFLIDLVFHGVRSRKLTDEGGTVRQVLNPL
jgi:hypothetical protein